MFPGYISIYKDKNKYIHLYFFKGIDDNLEQIYQDINLKHCEIEYTQNQQYDGAINYTFKSTKIKGMICTLIDKNGEEHKITLKI